MLGRSTSSGCSSISNSRNSTFLFAKFGNFQCVRFLMLFAVDKIECVIMMEDMPFELKICSYVKWYKKELDHWPLLHPRNWTIDWKNNSSTMDCGPATFAFISQMGLWVSTLNPKPWWIWRILRLNSSSSLWHGRLSFGSFIGGTNSKLNSAVWAKQWFFMQKLEWWCFGCQFQKTHEWKFCCCS